ncbi:hypothetical protein KKF34_17830 [Myxococcota bacterium]|nr:hypothetical protein [Myxococcota bacterium]MBU1382166.1 hypothetical protein [Myxococcota bacterium]MBU1498744.1 hypothetical protein [Myxococcota bacterium]
MNNINQDVTRFKPHFSRRVFLMMALTSFASALLTGGIGSFLSFRTIKKARINRGQEMVSYLANSSETAAISQDDTFLEGVFDRISNSKIYAGAGVYDNSGKLLFSRVPSGESAMPSELTLQAKHKNNTVHTYSESGNTLTLLAPVFVTRYNNSQITHGSVDKIDRKAILSGYAVFKITHSLEQNERTEVVVTGGILFISVFVIGLFFSWGSAAALSNPIRRIIKGVNLLNQGDLHNRIAVVSRDEMGQISDLINILAANLAQRMEELEKWGRLLEEKVQQRTKEVKLTKEFLHDLIAPISGSSNSWDSLMEILRIGTGADGVSLYFLRDKRFDLIAKSGQTSPPDLDIKERKTVSKDNLTITFLPMMSPTGITGQIVLTKSEGSISVDFADQVLPALTITSSNIMTFEQLTSVRAALEERTRILEVQREELIRQKEQIEAAAKLKSEFLANVSHELRIPLNAIIGYSEMLVAGYYGNISNEQKDTLSAIEESGRNLLNLINTILDHSRMEAGKLPLYVEMIDDLRKLLKDVVGRNQSLTREKDYRVELEIPDTPVPCMTDGGKIQQIVTNLVSNAVKFTQEGSVKVALVTSHNNIVISVTDTGIGIPEEFHDHIFEEFRQIDGSSTRSAGGTGLGLSVSRKMAHLIKGEITVKSTPGKGSVFSITFPRKIEKSEDQ